MLRIRILSVAAAATVITSALAASGAIAQSAGSDQPGKPLSLTQQTSASAAPSGNGATAVKKTHVRKVASRKHGKAATQEAEHEADQPADKPADAAQSNTSADAWLAASAPPAKSAPVSSPAQAQMAASDHAAQGNTSLPSAIVVNGQTVPIAGAQEVNAIDLTADNSPPDNSPPPMESTLQPSDRPDLAAALAAKASQVKDTQAQDSQVAFAASPPTAPAQSAGGENAGAQIASAQEANAQDANVQEASAQDTADQAAASQNSSPVGSATWIAQVLAALGGAVAAATVAWFLIGAGPQVRDYG